MRDWMIQSQKINYVSLFLAQKLAKWFSVLCSDVWDLMKHHTRSAQPSERHTFLAEFLVFWGTFDPKAGDQRNGFWRRLNAFYWLSSEWKITFFAVQGLAVPIDIQTKPEITNSHRNDARGTTREKHIWINLREICKLFINENKNARENILKRDRISTFYFHWWQPQRDCSCRFEFFIDHAFHFIHFHSVFMLTTSRLNKTIVNCGRIQGNWRLITKFDRQLHFISSRLWKWLNGNDFQARADRWTARLIDPDFHRRLWP